MTIPDEVWICWNCPVPCIETKEEDLAEPGECNAQYHIYRLERIERK